MDNKNQKNLKKYNLIMGIIHFLQGVAMVWLANDTSTTISQWLPVPPQATEEFARFNITIAPEEFIEVNFSLWIASFLFLSAIAHFITIIPSVYKWYIKNLEKEINMIRWYEYALSSSVMIVVIAYLCNIRDATIFALLFVINACMNLFGAMMEKHNSALKEKAKDYEELSKKVSLLKKKSLDMSKAVYKTDWTAFVYGCIAGILPWIVLAIYFFTTLDRFEGVFDEPVPTFVYYVLYILFVFFNLFAINMVLQYKKVGKWNKYLFGEYVYIFLSLAAKSTLAWIIFFGTLVD